MWRENKLPLCEPREFFSSTFKHSKSIALLSEQSEQSTDIQNVFLKAPFQGFKMDYVDLTSNALVSMLHQIDLLVSMATCVPHNPLKN